MTKSSKNRDRARPSPRGERQHRPVPAPALQSSRTSTRSTEDDLLDLVGSIYDAAVKPGLWPLALEGIVDAVGGTYGMFQIRSTKTMLPVFLEGARIDPEAIADYERYYHQTDLYAEVGNMLPQGSVVTTPEIVTPERLHKSEFYNDFLSRYDGGRLLAAVPIHTDSSDSLWANVSIYRADKKEEFGADEVALLRKLAPHFNRAFHIQIQASELQAVRDDADALLDCMAPGVILVDGRGQILAMNASAQAIVARDDGLSAGRTVLRAATPQQTSELHRLIAAAASPVRATLSGGVMAISRPSLKRSLAVSVSAFRPAALGWETQRPRAIVFVNDPELSPELPAEALRRLYGLTMAEARRAAALATGKTLRQYCEEVGISVQTVRGTLKQVFAKTDTNRQTELIKLLLNYAEITGRARS